MTPKRHIRPTFQAGDLKGTATSFGFTLVELLVSMTFLVILMLVVTQVIGIVQRTWVRANSRVSQFREARIAFDLLSRNLSQATLNTYWETAFDDLGQGALQQDRKKAKNYIRNSELQFVSGPTATLLTAAGGNSQDYPGHAVFFQAPLGVTKLVAASGTNEINTENMVNLLCGRGYFVEWGDDQPYRPPFLNKLNTVPTRSRLRLMEYSPTAEKNEIYRYRPITDRSNAGKWFQKALSSNKSDQGTVQDKETILTRAFTRPIAENVLALIISPQLETVGNANGNQYSIAPNYQYDSTLTQNPGATAVASNPQGTQHLLPPLLKVTMIALDERSGEWLSRQENKKFRDEVLTQTSSIFKNTADFVKDLDGTEEEPGTLEKKLIEAKVSYRVFTTTIALRQARWSY